MKPTLKLRNLLVVSLLGLFMAPWAVQAQSNSTVTFHNKSTATVLVEVTTQFAYIDNFMMMPGTSHSISLQNGHYHLQVNGPNATHTKQNFTVNTVTTVNILPANGSTQYGHTVEILSGASPVTPAPTATPITVERVINTAAGAAPTNAPVPTATPVPVSAPAVQSSSNGLLVTNNASYDMLIVMVCVCAEQRFSYRVANNASMHIEYPHASIHTVEVSGPTAQVSRTRDFKASNSLTIRDVLESRPWDTPEYRFSISTP